MFAIDRRPPGESELDDSANVTWFQIDLADADSVAETFEAIRREGGADALIHLAAYYDYTGEPHPEYQRTNVDALRVLLDQVAPLALKRFIFASSVGACAVPEPGTRVDERTPATGEHDYARTKRAGEEMLREAAGRVPSCIVRFAALISDWCEYPPLYVFLDTWLSRRWNARMLAGRGETAIPFLHVRDAVGFLLRVLERMDDLEPCEVLIAGADGAVSHRALFERATAYRYRDPKKPFLVPTSLCRPGMWVRDTAGRLLGERPFERPWMADYIDKVLAIDGTHTRRRLVWAPHPRLAVLNRIPFMIENMTTNPEDWARRNHEAMTHLELKPNFQVYRLLEAHRAPIAEAFAATLRAPGRPPLSEEDLDWTTRVTLRSLVQSIRTAERRPFMEHCRDLAERRLSQGVAALGVTDPLQALERICREHLMADPRGAHLGAALHDHLTMTVEFGVDRIQDVYEDTGRGRIYG